jgi:hypothetical protein
VSKLKGSIPGAELLDWSYIAAVARLTKSNRP